MADKKEVCFLCVDIMFIIYILVMCYMLKVKTIVPYIKLHNKEKRELCDEKLFITNNLNK